MAAFSIVLRRTFTIAAILAMFVGNALAQNCNLDTIIRVIDKHNQPVTSFSAVDLKAEIGGGPIQAIFWLEWECSTQI